MIQPKIKILSGVSVFNGKYNFANSVNRKKNEKKKKKNNVYVFADTFSSVPDSFNH